MLIVCGQRLTKTALTRISQRSKREVIRMSKGVSLREWLPLIGMMLSAFIFNSSEFMPIGLLTDIGDTFGTSEAQTGLIVSVYAWAVMILSLPLMVLATRVDFRRLFLVVLFVFFVGQVLSSVAVSYGMLMAARLVVACAHSVFWAIVAPIAVRVVMPHHQALALSVIEVGSAVAMVAGLPLGRTIGLLMSWRLTFACVACVALTLFLYMVRVMPKIPGAQPFGFSRLPTIFRNKALVGLFVLTALYSMGYYTGYSYIEPFFRQVASLEDGVITAALCVFGTAGIVSSFLYAKGYARFRFFFLGSVVVGLTLSLMLLRFAAVNVVFVMILCAVWGLSSAAFSIAVQAEIIRNAPGEEQTVAMAIFSGLFNLGIGTGTFFGGQVVTFLGIENIGFAGAILGLMASVYCFLVVIARLRVKPSRKTQ